MRSNANNHLHGHAFSRASAANFKNGSCCLAGLASIYWTTTLTPCPHVASVGTHTLGFANATPVTKPKQTPDAKVALWAATSPRQPGILSFALLVSAKAAPQFNMTAAKPTHRNMALHLISFIF
jgi:hypothetical protein